jgi:hypothetical protein
MRRLAFLIALFAVCQAAAATAQPSDAPASAPTAPERPRRRFVHLSIAGLLGLHGWGSQTIGPLSNVDLASGTCGGFRAAVRLAVAEAFGLGLYGVGCFGGGMSFTHPYAQDDSGPGAQSVGGGMTSRGRIWRSLHWRAWLGLDAGSTFRSAERYKRTVTVSTFPHAIIERSLWRGSASFWFVGLGPLLDYFVFGKWGTDEQIHSGHLVTLQLLAGVDLGL